MANYKGIIESSGNTSILLTDQPGRSVFDRDTNQIAILYNGIYTTLFFREDSTSFGASLRPVPNLWYGEQFSPRQAEVLPGESEVTVLFQDNGTYPRTAIVKFSLETGIETRRYNFPRGQFEVTSMPKGLPPGNDEGAPVSYVYATTYYSNVKQFESFYGFYPRWNDYLSRAQIQMPELFGLSRQSSSSQQSTTPALDRLTGSKGSPDVFQFNGSPSFNATVDVVTGFSSKDKDTIQISKSVFAIATGRFAVAKNPKTLNKLLSTDVDIIYNKKSGQLILNANGAEPGFGDDGGVFALLAGNPSLNNSSVSFV